MDSNQQQQETSQFSFKGISDFVEKQKQWINQEHDEETEQHQKMLQENSPQDLQKLGMAIVKMKCKSTKQGLYGRILITLTHPNYSDKVQTSETFANMVKLPQVKIQPGDNVGLFKMNEIQFQLNQKPLISGVVYKKNDFKIVLSVDNQNIDDFYDKNLVNFNELYSIIIEVNEVTHRRHTQAIKNIETISQDFNHPSRHLLSVLFGQEQTDAQNPNVKRSDILNYDPQKLNLPWKKKDLNDEQKDAIQFCLSRETVGLIHGPPGTGKTMTVCELIYQASKKGLKVLACAGSNIAVDNMVERIGRTDLKVIRIGHPARLLSTIKDKCLDAQVRKSSSFKILKELKTDLNKQLKKLQKADHWSQKKEIKNQIFDIKKEIRQTERLAVKEVVQEADVICCTNTGSSDRIFQYELENKQFDLVVIDEAAQTLEISCWLSMVRGRRVILAGDHKQLPPTVKSKNNKLTLTLFDRLLNDFEPEKVSRMLKVQYRMNSLIMDWSSNAVYDGQLKAAKLVQDHQIQDLREQLKDKVENDCVLMYIDTAGAKMGENIEDVKQDKTKSKSNQGETDLTKIIVKELINQGLYQYEVGVITPYNAQVDLIRQKISNFNNVEVSTVDGFQGREKECIVISMVRSNPMKQVGFLSDYRRMNVAITRARRFVCLIGDSDTVSSDPFLKNLVDYFEKFGELRSAFEYQNVDDNIAFNTGFIEMPQGYQVPENQAQKNEKLVQNQEKTQKKKKNKKKKNDQPLKQEEEKEETKENTEVIKAADIQVESGDQEKKEDEERLKLEKEYTKILQEYLDKKETEDLTLKKLNGFQRIIIHEIAESLNLSHISKGTGKQKNIVISNPSLQPQQQQQQQKTDNTQKKTQNVKQDTQKAQKNKEKKQKQKKQEEEMDDLAFLDAQIESNKFCSKDGCKQNIQILGVDCKFCQKRFCMKHSIAEAHGCDMAAKTHAKQQFKDQQYGKLAGKKYISPQEKDFMQKQLQEALKKSQNSRQTKPKKDSKKK